VTFPYYGTFWETFIGLKSPKIPFRPYGLDIPNGFSVKDSQLIRQAYAEMAEAHYSEFCELAGAHFQVLEAESSYTAAGPERLFRFLESFNGFYDHIGTARNMAFRIWDEYRVIARVVAPSSRIALSPGKLSPGKKSNSRIRKAMEAELLAYSKSSEIGDLSLIESEAITMRDHHIHDYGAYFLSAGNRLSFLLPALEVAKYKALFGIDVTEEVAIPRMKRHLQAIERFLDGSERVLAQELSRTLASVRIHVDY
jgi:hypothetical protein